MTTGKEIPKLDVGGSNPLARSSYWRCRQAPRQPIPE